MNRRSGKIRKVFRLPAFSGFLYLGKIQVKNHREEHKLINLLPDRNDVTQLLGDAQMKETQATRRIKYAELVSSYRFVFSLYQNSLNKFRYQNQYWYAAINLQGNFLHLPLIHCHLEIF